MSEFELETYEKVKKKMDFWKDTFLVIGSYLILLGIVCMLIESILLGIIIFGVGSFILYYRKKKYIKNRNINDEHAVAKNTYLLCGWVFVLSAFKSLIDEIYLVALINGPIGIGILYYRNKKYISKGNQ